MRRSVREAKAQELTLPRSSNGTLRLIDLEFEAMSDERRKARHHALSRSFAADVDIAIIRISHEAVSASLQLLIPFVEHQITQQWRQRPPLWYALTDRANQTAFHHSGLEEHANQLQHPLIANSRRYPRHQFVVTDPVEEFLQIQINYPA